MALAQDDQACLLCQNEIYLNPNMKLMMAVCGHKFCESCVTLTFLKAVAMNCPACPTQLKKNSFILQSLDDSALQKDNLIRKKIHKIYNKRREDFKELNDYNDYLETVEDIIFNLTTNTDVEATNEKVKRYSAENQQIIYVNQSKKAYEENRIKERIMEEERVMQEKKKQHILEDQEEVKQRQAERLEAIHNQNNKGQKGKPPPKKEKKEEPKKEDPKKEPSTPVTQEIIQQQSRQYIPQPNAPFAQQQQNITGQPAAPPPLAAQPLSSTSKPSSSAPVDIRMRERAGGYKEDYIKLRAMEEAFTSLFIPSRQTSITIAPPHTHHAQPAPMQV